MSQPDPPASDLGTAEKAELRARLEQRLANYAERSQEWGRLIPASEIRALLAALAAAEAERDAARSAVEEHRIAYTALTGERDQALLDRHEWQRIAAERDAAEQRATRLAALEQAARVWERDGSGRAESALLDAIEALDAPPGESP